MAFEIREACEQDIKDCARLAQYVGEKGWSENHFQAELAKPFSSVFLAFDPSDELDRGPVGLLLFWNLFQELHLLLLGVDPERRRKGIGSQLLQRFFLEGRVSLCRRAFLELRVSNESALAFYEAQGFQVAHRLNQFYPDSEDAFQMEYAFPRKDSF